MDNAFRAVGYIRVSTSEQRASGLGLAAQETAIRAAADKRGWELEIRTETASGSRGDRPVLNSALHDLTAGQILVVARLDRLTRSLVNFAAVVQIAQRRGWSLRVLDQGFDMSTASGRAMAGMLAVFAEYERELISERVRAAMRTLPRDRRNGRPVYDEAVRSRARVLRDRGYTLREIANALAAEGVCPARRGKRLYASTVSRLLEQG